LGSRVEPGALRERERGREGGRGGEEEEEEEEEEAKEEEKRRRWRRMRRLQAIGSAAELNFCTPLPPLDTS
jgi:hypothetical protein